MTTACSTVGSVARASRPEGIGIDRHARASARPETLGLDGPVQQTIGARVGGRGIRGQEQHEHARIALHAAAR